MLRFHRHFYHKIISFFFFFDIFEIWSKMRFCWWFWPLKPLPSFRAWKELRIHRINVENDAFCVCKWHFQCRPFFRQRCIEMIILKSKDKGPAPTCIFSVVARSPPVTHHLIITIIIRVKNRSKMIENRWKMHENRWKMALWKYNSNMWKYKAMKHEVGSGLK